MQSAISPAPKKSTSRLVLFIPVILGVLVVGGIVAHKFGWFDAVGSLRGGTSVADLVPPESQVDLAQTVKVTPEKGAVIRAVDAYGVASVLRIPPGAVADPIEITMTPFAPGGTDFHYGVEIAPNVTFEKPVSLSFNWFLAKSLSHENRYDKLPYVVMYDLEELTIVPIDKAVVADNYLPAVITRGGTYAVTDVPVAIKAAAKTVLGGEYSVLEQLQGALALEQLGGISKTEKVVAQQVLETVLAQEKPDPRELYTALQLEKLWDAKETSLINRAMAYGLLDGYLQYRCELKESTYEEVRNAMLAAAQRGYDEVVKTCKREAEDRLIARANTIDQNPNRPLIDAVEVLQQMQLFGLDDPGGRGATVAARLEADIIASLNSYATARGETNTEVSNGRVRENTPSNDPLLKGNADLTKEMIGVSVLPLIGVDSFDEAGFKKFGERVQEQIGGLNMITEAMCDVSELLGREVLGYVDPYLAERCQMVRSGEVLDAADVLKQDIDEMAEGVDAIQRGQDPNSNWNDYAPSEAAADRLER